MSNDEIEEVVQQNSYLLREYLLEVASKQFSAPVYNLEMTATQTIQKFGATGQILLSTIYFNTEYGESHTNVALKFFSNDDGAMTELRNSIELDFKFRSHPHFATPKIIFASTKDPVMLIYEGLDAINYDECPINDKPIHAGQLLAAIHGGLYRPVNTSIYKNLARMIGSYITSTGMEKSITDGLGRVYIKFKNAQSGCNPFSDFHQSNVMLGISENKISKVYIIDPEFMQKGSFDRMEDIGTFFAFQLLNEFKINKSINKGMKDIDEFLQSYEQKNLSIQGITWRQMYPNGCPLAFFIAQWAIMDCIDKSLRLEIPMTDPDLMFQLKFAEFILNSDPFVFPRK